MSVTFCLPGSPCAPGAKKQGPGTASRMTEGPQCCGETAECRNVTKFQPGLVPLLFQGRGSQVHIEDLQVFPSCSPCTGFLLGVLLFPHPCAETPAPWQHSDNSPAPFILGQPQLAEICHPGAGLCLSSAGRELPEALQP